jgi:predicted thioesterase
MKQLNEYKVGDLAVLKTHRGSLFPTGTIVARTICPSDDATSRGFTLVNDPTGEYIYCDMYDIEEYVSPVTQPETTQGETEMEVVKVKQLCEYEIGDKAVIKIHNTEFNKGDVVIRVKAMLDDSTSVGFALEHELAEYAYLDLDDIEEYVEYSNSEPEQESVQEQSVETEQPQVVALPKSSLRAIIQQHLDNKKEPVVIEVTADYVLHKIAQFVKNDKGEICRKHDGWSIYMNEYLFDAKDDLELVKKLDAINVLFNFEGE